MKLKRWAEARPCSLLGHDMEFGFYFLVCNGKLLEGFKPEKETDKIRLALKRTLWFWKDNGILSPQSTFRSSFVPTTLV